MAGRLSDSINENVKAEIYLSELRIRNWVLAGLLTNVIAWIPVIFFLGSMHRDISDAISQVSDVKTELNGRRTWMNEREMWEMSTQQWMTSKGYQAPPLIRKDHK